MHTHALFLLDRSTGIHLFVEMLRIQAMKPKILNADQKPNPSPAGIAQEAGMMTLKVRKTGA